MVKKTKLFTLLFALFFTFVLSASRLVAFANVPQIDDLSNEQWQSLYNNNEISWLKTWAEENEISSETLQQMVVDAMQEAMDGAVEDGILPSTFNWGEPQGYGVWEGVLKFEYRDGDNTADVWGRRHLMIVISRASTKEDGTLEAYLMVNDIFQAWHDQGNWNRIGYPASKPFKLNDGEAIYQNYEKGYFKFEDGKVVFTYNENINPENGRTKKLGLPNPIGQLNDVVKDLDWVKGSEELITKEFNRAYERIKNSGFDIGYEAGPVELWDGVIKQEFRGGDHNVNKWGRIHGVIAMGNVRPKRAFAVVNEIFSVIVGDDSNANFTVTGGPISERFELVEGEKTYIVQNFQNGYIKIEKGTYYEKVDGQDASSLGYYVANKYLQQDGTETDIPELVIISNIGELDSPENLPEWAKTMDPEVIKAEFIRVYKEMLDMGFDLGDTNGEPARRWGDGTGSGGEAETLWLRQEFVGGDHHAYLWNRVHGYIFMGPDGKAYPVFNEILLEWHGGWADKGGPTSMPYYVTVTLEDGTEVTDIYQNFEYAYIVVPNGDRSLVRVIPGASITEEEALKETKVRYGLESEEEEPVDPDNPNAPGDEDDDPGQNNDAPKEDTKNNTVWIVTGIVAGVLVLAGAAAFIILKKKQ